jgi:6-phosphogluconolactonase
MANHIRESAGGKMEHRVYISLMGEDKISIYTLKSDTGELTLQRDVVARGGPAPLAVDPARHMMYAGLRSTCEMATFRLDLATGDLSLIGTTDLRSDPCYVATDRTGRFLLSAYYGAGMVAVHPIGTDGMVGETAAQWVETAGHAHCIQPDRSNRFVFVPHTVPANRILQFLFDESSGMLVPNAIPEVIAGEGQGPRHYCYHPSRDVVYVSNEQGCSVTTYHFDASAGTLSASQTAPTLPQGYAGENTCAQIHIHPSGRFLYVSNRGQDSIAMFSIDDVTGELTPLGQQLTESSPRVFNIDPAGKYLLAAGQSSGRLAVHRIDGRTGVLMRLETYAVGQNPMWVLIM